MREREIYILCVCVSYDILIKYATKRPETGPKPEWPGVEALSVMGWLLRRQEHQDEAGLDLSIEPKKT